MVINYDIGKVYRDTQFIKINSYEMAYKMQILFLYQRGCGY